jgi:hypothetical protein
VDVLVSGSERPDFAPLAGWRAPRWLVGLLAVAALATAGAGLAVADAVRAAEGAASLQVEARSVLAVRPRGRDGVLLLQLRHGGRTPLRVALDALDVDGVRTAAPPPVDVPAGAAAELAVPVAVRDCDALGAGGVVRLVVETAGRREAVEREVPADALTAGCRPPGERSVAVAVAGGGGTRRVEGAGVRGVVTVQVRNLGTDLRLVRVDAEVPGVIASSGSLRVPAGAEGAVRLGFHVPDCAALRRTGRVVLEVQADGVGTRELGFRATEDEEARTVRDLDLDVLLRGCRAGRPVP